MINFMHIVASLIPRLPQFFYVTHRKTREPCKIYHIRDVEVEAMRRALTMTHQFLMAIVERWKIDDLSVPTIVCHLDHLRLSFVERRTITPHLWSTDRFGHSWRLIVPRTDICPKVAWVSSTFSEGDLAIRAIVVTLRSSIFHGSSKIVTLKHWGSLGTRLHNSIILLYVRQLSVMSDQGLVRHYWKKLHYTPPLPP